MITMARITTHMARLGVSSNGTRRGALTGALLIVSCSGSCVAGDWTFRPLLSFSETLSDNVTRGDEGKGVSKGDLITEVTPGFSLSGTGSRVQADIYYELAGINFLHDSSRNSLNNRLSLNSTLELLDSRFFLDARASYFQVANSPSSTTSSDSIGLSGQASDIGTLFLSPYWKERFGGVAESLFKLTLGRTQTSNNSDGGASSSSLMSNSDTRGLSWNIGSIAGTGRLSWQAAFNDEVTSYDDGQPDDKRRNSAFDTRWQLNEDWSLLGRLGNEQNTLSDSTSNDTNGSYWSGGVGWTPSRYLGVDTYYGSRDKEVRVKWNPTERTALDVSWRDRSVGLVTGPSWAMNFSQKTANSVWTATYSDEVTTQQSSALQNGGYFTYVDPTTGQAIYLDPTTGQLIARDQSFGLRNGTYETKRFELSTTYFRGHSQIFGRVFHEDRSYSDGTGDGTSYGADASWTWQFAPRTRSTVGVTWQKVNDQTTDTTSSTGSGSGDGYLRGRVGLSHDLSADASAAVEYQHISSDGGSGVGSGSSSSAYDENRLTLSLNMRF